MSPRQFLATLAIGLCIAAALPRVPNRIQVDHEVHLEGWASLSLNLDGLQRLNPTINVNVTLPEGFKLTLPQLPGDGR